MNPDFEQSPAPPQVYVHAADSLARAGLVVLLEAECVRVLPEGGSEPADAVIVDAGADPEGALADVPEGSPVLALAVDAQAALLAWRFGASGLFYRDTPIAEVAAALPALAAGLVVLDRRLAPELLPASSAAPLEALTERETEVLRLLAAGLTNAQVAARLGVAESTAKFHVAGVMAKLGASSRTDAVVRGARAGLVAL